MGPEDVTLDRISEHRMLTSGAQRATSSFPTSLAWYLVPTTSGLRIEVGFGGDADYLAITLELQPNRVDVQRKGSANKRPDEVGTDLLHSAQDTGWRPGRRLVFGGFKETPATVFVVVAICSGLRC